MLKCCCYIICLPALNVDISASCFQPAVRPDGYQRVPPACLATGHVDEHMEMGMLAYYTVHSNTRHTLGVPRKGHLSMLYLLLIAPATIAAAVGVVYVRRGVMQRGRQSLIDKRSGSVNGLNY
jgi:hypothetical protein